MDRQTIEHLKEGRKMIEDGLTRFRQGGGDYYIDVMFAAYEAILEKYAPFEIGERVVLKITPEISETKSYGWLGSKHFLKRGALGKVSNIEFNRDKTFSVYVTFDDESWIDSMTKEIDPRPHKHSYHFKPEDLCRVSAEAAKLIDER